MSADDRVVYWQRRCRDAERVKEYIEAEMESNRRWMTHCFDEERHLRDRCGFLYAIALAHGASREELAGSYTDTDATTPGHLREVAPLVQHFPADEVAS